MVHSKEPPRPVVLTGGIGSGKSSVARLLREWGAHVVDADVLAREVVAPGSPGLAAVVAEFGAAVLAPDGSLDRAALAERVFADRDRLSRLEAIIHPLVHAAAVEQVSDQRGAVLVVYEVPLPGSSPFADEPVVVVVDAPERDTSGATPSAWARRGPDPGPDGQSADPGEVAHPGRLGAGQQWERGDPDG